MRFWVYTPDGRLLTQFDGYLQAVRYEDPDTAEQEHETYFLSVTMAFDTETFRYIPNESILTFPCYDRGDYYVSYKDFYDTDTGLLYPNELAIDKEGNRVAVVLSFNDQIQYLLVASTDAAEEPQKICTYFQEFLNKQTVENNFDIGAVLEEYESDMRFWVYASKRRIFDSSHSEIPI